MIQAQLRIYSQSFANIYPTFTRLLPLNLQSPALNAGQEPLFSFSHQLTSLFLHFHPAF